MSKTKLASFMESLENLEELGNILEMFSQCFISYEAFMKNTPEDKYEQLMKDHPEIEEIFNSLEDINYELNEEE